MYKFCNISPINFYSYFVVTCTLFESIITWWLCNPLHLNHNRVVGSKSSVIPMKGQFPFFYLLIHLILKNKKIPFTYTLHIIISIKPLIPTRIQQIFTTDMKDKSSWKRLPRISAAGEFFLSNPFFLHYRDTSYWNPFI